MAKKTLLAIRLFDDGGDEIDSDFDTRWFRDLIADFERKVIDRFDERTKSSNMEMELDEF
jgi:hypothetical protein